ncbi:calcium-binding protein [Nitrobacter sp. TKz-YC02]|uniref:calcium-binding protein n=1 Tax=Nitrobacter sp. TKz-YC02 TaxID=3398704 RepID=UPI003CF51023
MLDRNGNGAIDDITEMVSVKFAGGNFADGFAALTSLAQFGAVSFSRATSRTNPATGNLYFDEVRIWVDANADGQTDAGELKTLDELGITAISLQGSGNQGEAIAGNDVINRASYTRDDGTTGQVASVDFEADGASVTTTEVTGAVIVRAEGAETVTSYVVTDDAGQTINASTFTLADSTHPDAFYSTTGDDSFLVDVNDTRSYWLGGGTGFDLVKVNDTEGVTLDLAAAHVEEVIGDDGSDTFNASGMTSTAFLDGAGGNDILIGGIANDAITGNSGDDYIDGNAGNDVLRGGDGDDIVFGEGGPSPERLGHPNDATSASHHPRPRQRYCAAGPIRGPSLTPQQCSLCPRMPVLSARISTMLMSNI